MMVYKVVEKQTRNCTNMVFLKDSAYRYDAHERLKKIKKRLKGYLPRYFKGKVVEAMPNSFGIMTFEHKVDAEHFISNYPELTSCKIIKVEGIGDPTYNPYVHPACGDMFNIESITDPIDRDYNVQGTITFPKVKVLE